MLNTKNKNWQCFVNEFTKILFDFYFFSRNEKSAKLLKMVLVQEKLNHYGSMAQRGLSSSFSRKFINYNNITGLVKNSQHIYSGVTKRGSVDIVLERDSVQYDLCSVSICSAFIFYSSTTWILIYNFSLECSPLDLDTSHLSIVIQVKKKHLTRTTCQQQLAWN